MTVVLTDEQAAVVELVREFVTREVAPVAATLDRHDRPEDCFSWELVEKASAAGLRTLTLAEEHGGSGVDFTTTALAVREMAKGDMGLAVVFAQTWKLVQTLQSAGTADQRARYLPRYAADPRALLAITFTEPDTASDYFVPHDGARYATTAVKVDGGWRLNGLKHFISNGNRASLYIVFAQTDTGRSLEHGSTAFLVPRDTAGLSIGRVHDKLGERLANNAEVIFSDCFVPDEDILGEPGRGFQVQQTFFPASNAYAAATVLGVAEAAYDRALAWARRRVQGGRPIIQHDSVASDLAEMRMWLDATELYVLHAAWAGDHPEAWDPLLGALPKVLASQVGWKVVTRAMELHGGYGYMKETGMEKLLRDAAAFLHSDGVNRTLLLKAADHLR